MTVDVRAKVQCSLGEVISGSISDGYVQGNGLILVRGSLELNELITPAMGTPVTFSYKQGGNVSIPRKLRVLSSFADPFRGTTKIDLGCKLTYLSDAREKLSWDAFDDPENLLKYDPEDYEVIPVPVSASSMMNFCLEKLGITASSNPLTSQFSAGQYDFSSGWVNVLGELLISEGYCGYLNRSEVLQIFSLNQNGGSGPVITADDIIDVGAINAGQLPGEAVTVSYSALRLKADPTPGVNGWQQSSKSNRTSVTINYRAPISQTQQSITYDVLETVEELSDFQTITKASTKEKINVMRYRKLTRTESSPKRLGNLMVQFLEAGLNPPVAQLREVTEEWFYYDSEAIEIRNISETYADKAYAYGELNLPMVFDETTGAETGNPVTYKVAVSIPFGATYLKEATETETIVQGTLRKVITTKYGNWIATIAGQQAVAESRESFTTTGQVADYITKTLDGKYLLGTEIYTEESTASGQRVPVGSASKTQTYSRDDGRQQNETKIVLALGSPTAERRIEFTLPMAPDDIIIKENGAYKIIPNNAYNVAKKFGVIQNRLLMANRKGMNIRVNPLLMPAAPFAPLMLQAKGLTAMYRTNGTTWTFSSDGIIASTDALFWGGVGS